MLKERDDDLAEITSLGDYVVPKIFFVVVVPPIAVDRPNSEEFPEFVQGSHAPGALDHNKRMTHLPPGSITDSIVAAGLTSQADGKTTFAVNETE